MAEIPTGQSVNGAITSAAFCPVATRGHRSLWRKSLRRVRRSGHFAFLIPGLLFLGALTLFPLVQMIRLSFSNVTGTNLLGHWSYVGLANLSALVHSPGFRTAIYTSLIFTGCLLAVNLFLGFTAARWFTQPTRISKIAQGVMILGFAMPGVVVGTIWRFLLGDSGVINAMLNFVGIGPVPFLSSARLALYSMIAVTAWGGIPFAMMVLKGSLLGIPKDLVEAAQLDGARPAAITRWVILPLLRPVFLILGLLIIVYGFGNSFALIYIVTQGGPGTATTTVPYFAYLYAFTNLQFSLGAAVALLTMMVVIIVTIAYVRVTHKVEEGQRV